MTVEFHPEAYEEMIESARYYEERSEGLGGDFLAAVEETTSRIRQFPGAAPIERARVRKRLVLGFPFIAAVMHQHRRPGYWKHRVPSRRSRGSTGVTRPPL